MDFAVIRNNSQRDKLIAEIKQRRLPFKVAVKDIYPDRTIDFNAYLWGFIYGPLSLLTGHTAEEVHEECKRKFNWRYDFEYNNELRAWEFVSGVRSTTKTDNKEMMDYVLKIRAEAQIILGITLLLPDECWIDELIFEAEL